MLLVGCYGGVGSADNPNTDQEHVSGRAYRWSVRNEMSAQLIASGCSSSPPYPNVAAEPGDRLHYELLAEIVRKQHAGSDDAWWCNDQALVARFPATQVENLDCFTLPEAGPVLVERWEPVPADADVEPTLPTRMKGQGFRLWLDVRAPGALVLAPNGQCGQGSLAVLRIDG